MEESRLAARLVSAAAVGSQSLAQTMPNYYFFWSSKATISSTHYRSTLSETGVAGTRCNLSGSGHSRTDRSRIVQLVSYSLPPTSADVPHRSNRKALSCPVPTTSSRDAKACRCLRALHRPGFHHRSGAVCDLVCRDRAYPTPKYSSRDRKSTRLNSSHIP